MNNPAIITCPAHLHNDLTVQYQHNEKRIWLVISLTLITMIAEIVAGFAYGSMALLADGWHMATHVGAMLISVIAYICARRYLHDQRFSFGTGKLTDLAGFASAVLLILIVILVGFESLMRLTNPEQIAFEQALLVATIGLIINLVCAYLLQNNHHNHQHHSDNNLRAVYIHVLTDALTSITAIVALLLGKFYGLIWADALIGLLGALVITVWAIRLMRDTGFILLDASPENIKIHNNIYQILNEDNVRLTDLHVWQVSQQNFAAIIALQETSPKPANWYKDKLKDITNLTHITIETETLAV